jgi:O-acetyl-ADP-ribose deacetylase (regulator of RNase III)
MQIRARQGGCTTGEAVLTTAGKLPARFVISYRWPGVAGRPQQRIAVIIQRLPE